MAGLLSLALILSLSIMPGQGTEVQAASKNYMKKLSLKWDLKKNKKVTCKLAYDGIGKKKASFKITDYKIRKAKKKGYKQLTFTLTVKNEWKPKKSEIHKLAMSSYSYKTIDIVKRGEEDSQASPVSGTDFQCYIVDYNTGLSLAAANAMEYDTTEGLFGVTVETKKVKTGSAKKYKDSDGCIIRLSTWKQYMSVIYPEKYKGLCIGVGGNNVTGYREADDGFLFGGYGDSKALPFGKSTYYKKGKTNSHWMRVN